MFNDCTALTSVNLDGCLGITQILPAAFEKTALLEIDLSGCTSLTKIFDREEDKGIVTTNGVFENCKSLTSIKLPDSLEEIGRYAFAGCDALTEIDFSDSGLQQISGNAFYGCVSLVKVDVSGSKLLRSVGGAFSECTSLQELDLSDCSLLTQPGVFTDYTNLQKVNLSNCTSLATIGQKMFFGCTALSEIDLAGCTSLVTIATGSFNRTALTEIDLSECTALTTITRATLVGQTYQEDGAFQGCANLETIKIPKSLAEIGVHAFKDCVALGDLDFSNSGLKEIMSDAFAGCTSITKVNLSNCTELTAVENAFKGCSEITEFNFSGCSKLNKPGVYKEFKKMQKIDFSNCQALALIQKEMFMGCIALETVLLDGCTTLLKIAGGDNVGGTYQDNGPFSGCTKLKSITFPENLQEIGSRAFNGCSELTEISLVNSGLKKIYSQAFSNCVALIKVNLSNSTQLTTIEDKAFDGCSQLQEINFSGCSSLTGLGSFSRITSLQKVDLSYTGLTSIAKSTFCECTNLSSVNLSGCTSLTTIGTSAFYMTALTSIDLSDCTALTGISGGNNYGMGAQQDGAFGKCAQLQVVILPNNAIKISLGYNAFTQDMKSTLKLICVPASKVAEYKADSVWKDFANAIQNPFEVYSLINC